MGHEEAALNDPKESNDPRGSGVGSRVRASGSERKCAALSHPATAAQRSPEALRPREARRRPNPVQKRLARDAVDFDRGQVQTTSPISQNILREGTPQPAVERHKRPPGVFRQSPTPQPGPLPAGSGAKAEKLLNPAAISFNGVVSQPALPGHRLEMIEQFHDPIEYHTAANRVDRIFCFDKWPPSGQAGEGQPVLCCDSGRETKRFIHHMQASTPTWKGTPFEIGRRYRVLKAASSLPPEQSLAPGEVVTYQQCGYSRYDSTSIFAFTNEEGVERSWWLHDDEPLENLRDVFAAIESGG